MVIEVKVKQGDIWENKQVEISDEDILKIANRANELDLIKCENTMNDIDKEG